MLFPHLNCFFSVLVSPVNSQYFKKMKMMFFFGHSIISGLESWSGVLEWSGVKIGVDFGVKFGVEVGFFLVSQWSVQLSRNSQIYFKHHTGFSEPPTMKS